MDAHVEWIEPGGLLAPLEMPGAHVVHLYRDDDALLETLDPFVDEGLAAGDAVVVIATRAHLSALAARAAERGTDLAGAAAAGRWVALDAAAALATFMAGGRPIASRFTDSVGDVITRAADASRHGHVRAFGEMVALLWTEGRREAALHLEDLWNELAWTEAFSLLCAYPVAAFEHPTDTGRLDDVCDRHSHAAPAGVSPAS